MINQINQSAKSKPLCIQMLIACVYSCIVILSVIHVRNLLTYENHLHDIMNFDFSGFIVYSALLIAMLLPINILILYSIHVFKIFPYLIYSNRLVILETLVFMTDVLILQDIFNNTLVAIVIILTSNVLCIFIGRMIFSKFYNIFQQNHANLYNSAISKRTDLILTFSIYAIPSLAMCIAICIS